MELRDYVRILKRRGWLVILLMVMTAAAAFAFSKFQTPIYKSSVDILVQPDRPDFGLAQSAKLLLRSYVSWMNTDTRAQAVIEQLQLDRMRADLRSDVTIASDESRLVIQINVEDPDGDQANDIARVWRDLFIQWRDEENSQLRKEDRVKAIELDAPVYGLARPKWQINVLAGAILGALVGGIIIFVLEWIESGVVRQPDDIGRYLDLPLLGTIPASKIDTSRPYLLGDRRKSRGVVSAVAPPYPAANMGQAAPAVTPEPSVLASPPATPQPAATLQSPPSAALQTPLAPPAAEEEIGPVEPTILLSKGDEL